MVYLRQIQYLKTIDVEIMDTNVNNSILKHGFGINNTQKKLGNKYEP
jgi:hypothetical protein